MATVLRADAVMRTGVIRPFVGFNPSVDVQTIAQRFTTGGPLATQLSGLGAPGPIATWWANLKARIAARKAARASFAGGAPGPEMSTANQVAPQMQAQMQLLNRLTNPGHTRGAIAQAADTLAARRQFTYYRAG